MYSCLITNLKELFCLACSDEGLLVIELLDEAKEKWKSHSLQGDQKFLGCKDAVTFVAEVEDGIIWVMHKMRGSQGTHIGRIDLQMKLVIESNYSIIGNPAEYWGAFTQIPYKYVENYC